LFSELPIDAAQMANEIAVALPLGRRLCRMWEQLVRLLRCC